MDAQFYTHSGDLHFRSAITAAGISLVGVVILSVAYAGVLTINPWVYLNLVAVAIFGGGCGAVFGYVTKQQLIRSEPFVLYGSLVFGLIAVWLQWVFYIGLNSPVGVQALLPNPALLWEGILFFNQEPPYTLFDLTPSGALGWIIWSFEAAIVLLVAFFIAEGFAGQQDNIFCEECEIWTDNALHTALLETPADSHTLVAQALETGNIDNIIELAEVTTTVAGQTCLRLKLDTCPVCDKLNVLDIISVSFEEDDKGELKESSEVVLQNLLIDASTARVLRAKHPLVDIYDI